MQKSLHYFDSYGSRCEADLYLPGASKPPVVVLAQGYAAERDFGTKGIIKAIVDAGIAVFAFDYRGFGGSDSLHNEERQLVDPQRQVEDYHSALRYVSTLNEIDAQRIGIWGSSFSGGHVISVAGSDWCKSFPLRAVVAQIPHCDSSSAVKHIGFKKAFGGLSNGIKGTLLDLVGVNYTVPVVGKPAGPFAVMQHTGWYEGYLLMVDPASQWQNAVPAKSLFKAAGYNPINVARNISVPVLMVYGLKDQGIPVDDVQRTSNFIKDVEMFSFDGDHFDAYDGGAHHAAIVKREVEFLVKHLKKG